MLRFLGVLHFIVVFLWLPPPVSARISGGRRFWVATPILGCRYGATVFGRLGAFLMVLRLPLCSTTGGDGARCECRVYPVGAPMAKKHPPGGEGLSHTPADGGDYPSKGTLLPPFVNGWRTGPVCPPVTSGGQKTGFANRGLGPAWLGTRWAANVAERTEDTGPRLLCAPRRIYLGDRPGEPRPHGRNRRPPRSDSSISNRPNKLPRTHPLNWFPSICSVDKLARLPNSGGIFPLNWSSYQPN